MYNDTDLLLAGRRVKRCIAGMAAVLLPLLAVYVLGVVRGMYGLILAALILMFAFSVFAGDLWLLPALRYRRFLKEMGKGLRRSADCILESMDVETQVQDGVQVRALHVRLCEGGDSRIFYVNASKLELLPEMKRHVRLESYGRHVTACKES